MIQGTKLPDFIKVNTPTDADLQTARQERGLAIEFTLTLCPTIETKNGEEVSTYGVGVKLLDKQTNEERANFCLSPSQMSDFCLILSDMNAKARQLNKLMK